MSAKPAANVPMTAPIVFAEYRRPNASLRASSRAKWRTSAGNVAPIITVAGASASTASARRTITSIGVPSIAG